MSRLAGVIASRYPRGLKQFSNHITPLLSFPRVLGGIHQHTVHFETLIIFRLVYKCYNTLTIFISFFINNQHFTSLYFSTRCRGDPAGRPLLKTKFRHNTHSLTICLKNYTFSHDTSVGANPCACTVCLSFGFALFKMIIFYSTL